MDILDDLILEKDEVGFAEPREVIFDIDDGFIKQKLADDEFLPLFHWETADGMVDGSYSKTEFDNLLYNHTAEFVDLVYANELNEYLFSASKERIEILKNIADKLGGGALNESIAIEIYNS